MSLENVDLLELKDRYSYLIETYTKLALEVAPLLEKFGKCRKELQLITVEFDKRGVNPEDPESLQKLIEEELRKRSQGSEENGRKTEEGL